MATTLGANPGTNPGANKRESKLEANARSQDTAARVPRFARMTTTNLVQTVSEPREAGKYPGIVKVTGLGLGAGGWGLGAPGPDGPGGAPQGATSCAL